MVAWVLVGLVLLLAVVSWADARNRSNLPKRSWNIWIGPKPQDGEGYARFTLRRALASLVTLAVLVLPLFFVSAPPGERANFTGNESVLGLAVVIVFAPLAAMTFLTLMALLFSALVYAIFRRRKVFDSAMGDFVRR